jgi:peptidoglycan/LPS O-acetylase OafA/YrhL
VEARRSRAVSGNTPSSQELRTADLTYDAEMPALEAPPVVAPPPGHPRFPLIDSLRAVAVLGVLFGHVGSVSHETQSHFYGAWVANLTVGVCIFFVLSGFLLYRPFISGQLGAAPRPRIADYTRRRVLRIIPAYWLALTVLAIYPGLAGVHGADWWRYYGLLQVYEPLTTLSGLPVAWSLCIEASFYLALPIFALATMRLTRRLDRDAQVRAMLGILAVLAVASVALRAVDRDVVLSNSLPTYLYWFAIGMTLAVLSVAWHDAPSPPRLVRFVRDRPAACWAVALVLYAILGAALTSAPQHLGFSDRQLMIQHVLRGGIAFFLVLPAVFGDGAGGWPRRVLGWRRLQWLGLISYGFYLWHLEVVRVLSAHFSGHWWPLLVSSFLVSAAVAAGSYYIVERPILRFKNWRPGGRAGKNPQPPVPADPEPAETLVASGREGPALR